MLGYIDKGAVLEISDEMIHQTLTREHGKRWPFEIEGPYLDMFYEYIPGETDITGWKLWYTAGRHRYLYIFEKYDFEKMMWECKWPD